MFYKHTTNTEDYADRRLQEQDWATVVCELLNNDTQAFNNECLYLWFYRNGFARCHFLKS